MSTNPAPPPDADDQGGNAHGEGALDDPALVAALRGWGATLRYGLLRLAIGWPTLMLAAANVADSIASYVTGR